MADGFLIGSDFLGRIRRTVDASEAAPYKMHIPGIPVRFEGEDGGGNSVRIGKTTSAWNKGSLATIELYEQGTPPDEARNGPPYELADCINKFASVGSGKWVMVAKAGNGRWYLISAECD